MKKRLLNSIRIAIKKQYPSYSNDKMDEIMYGIEGIYLTITKTIVIFILAFILKGKHMSVTSFLLTVNISPSATTHLYLSTILPLVPSAYLTS